MPIMIWTDTTKWLKQISHIESPNRIRAETLICYSRNPTPSPENGRRSKSEQSLIPTSTTRKRIPNPSKKKKDQERTNRMKTIQPQKCDYQIINNVFCLQIIDTNPITRILLALFGTNLTLRLKLLPTCGVKFPT